MRLFSDEYQEILGIPSEDHGSFIKIDFITYGKTSFVPKIYIKNQFDVNNRQPQKLLLPVSFLKRSRIIPLVD